ncbi:MAG: metalloregulator ArsR/SmtB family transcription factor [Eubacterium aggregans]|uniref:ArsR/SmtB family transcription factor n=1 Tax=Eubacterium aggregans TaxID=81409 RepID=UPI0023F0C59C|nr:metalloregulator ArsR/SmtB family transcription factor [Eubacterium aggregans]MDD4691546.1 metalloregulator ArsR/SmtB family transcription factor [Eubacterium aggregans]MEA5074470.1 metalloregulator ArsR/SmtB family transcription factor [Eubacterium aggregans]
MITETLKTLSDATRLRILNLLSHGEMCVCELEYLLGIKQSNLSKHLGILERNHFILRNRKNKFVYCQINYEFLDQCHFAEEILSLLKSEEPFSSDEMNYQTYLNSSLTYDCLPILLLEERLKEKRG